MGEQERRYSEQYGRQIGQFSPEGINILRSQFTPEEWPQMRQWIAEARAGERTGPMASDIPNYEKSDLPGGGRSQKKQELDSILRWLLASMQDQQVRPGSGTAWGNSWTPTREWLGDTGTFGGQKTY
jgi:hypothetical protein